MSCRTAKHLKLYVMEIKVSIAILSHLSDAQHLMMAGNNSEADKHIHFVKLLTLRYQDTQQEVAVSELDAIWNYNI
jgi:phosphoheptose isomerase